MWNSDFLTKTMGRIPVDELLCGRRWIFGDDDPVPSLFPLVQDVHLPAVGQFNSDLS